MNHTFSRPAGSYRGAAIRRTPLPIIVAPSLDDRRTPALADLGDTLYRAE